MWRIIVITVVILSGGATADSSKTCDDIDTAACHLIASQRPDVCSDLVLAKSACARYCNLCPVECYHCNTSVTDYHTCTTTKLCGPDEMCMRKTLSSSADGHHEYQLTCESKQLCDGNGLVLAFGKRNIDVRDVSVHCCSDDLCNYPNLPMPTSVVLPACKKDVIVLVDNSHGYWSSIEHFLETIISGFQIGQNSILMSLAQISSSTTSMWDLNRYTDTVSLITALRNVSIHTACRADRDSHDRCETELTSTLSFIANYAISPASGNRPDADDIIIIFTEDHMHSSLHSSVTTLIQTIHHDTQNVVVVGIGRHADTGKLHELINDKTHEFKIKDPSELPTISNTVVNMISC